MRPSQLMRSFRSPMCTVLLLLAVIAWGLHSKASRYTQEAAHRLSSGIPAKLLNDGEKSLIWKNAAQSNRPESPIGLISLHVRTAELYSEPAHSNGGLISDPHDQVRQYRLCGRSSFRAPPRA